MHEPDKPIRFHPSNIYSENPKRSNQSFNAFQMSFRKNDQNGGAHGKNLIVFKVEKLHPQQEETIRILLHLIKLNNKYIFLVLSQSSRI